MSPAHCTTRTSGRLNPTLIPTIASPVSCDGEEHEIEYIQSRPGVDQAEDWLSYVCLVAVGCDSTFGQLFDSLAELL